LLEEDGLHLQKMNKQWGGPRGEVGGEMVAPMSPPCQEMEKGQEGKFKKFDKSLP